METFEAPDKALLVIPHPDDGESGCGGTVSKWIAEGTKVLYVVCTNGDKGTSDLAMTRDRLAKIRYEEQKEAVRALGVHELVWLGYGDGELEDNSEFRELIVHEIRRFKPDVVLAMDPVRNLSHSHRDHRKSGQVALDACFPYSRDVLHYEDQIRKDGLESHKVKTILLWGTENPDIAIDIEDTISNKLEALAKHKSQLSMARDDMDQFVKSWAKRAAERAEGTGYKYAETFRKISFRL